MSDLASELKENYKLFRAKLRKDFRTTEKAIDADEKQFLPAYQRLAGVNSWRVDILATLITEDVMGFMLEAQNDGLSSLAFATVGAWRTSLQGLRSMIENSMMGLYFADHSVEHQLWVDGRYKVGFSFLLEYFKSHPSNSQLPQVLDPISALRAEYDTLSKAVHGRAPFRMTKDSASTVVLDPSSLLRGAYLTRQRETIRSLTLLNLMLFSGHLEGTKQQELRKLLAMLFSASARTTIKMRYKIVL